MEWVVEYGRTPRSAGYRLWHSIRKDGATVLMNDGSDDLVLCDEEADEEHHAIMGTLIVGIVLGAGGELQEIVEPEKLELPQDGWRRVSVMRIP